MYGKSIFKLLVIFCTLLLLSSCASNKSSEKEFKGEIKQIFKPTVEEFTIFKESCGEKPYNYAIKVLEELNSSSLNKNIFNDLFRKYGNSFTKSDPICISARSPVEKMFSSIKENFND